MGSNSGRCLTFSPAMVLRADIAGDDLLATCFMSRAHNITTPGTADDSRQESLLTLQLVPSPADYLCRVELVNGDDRRVSVSVLHFFVISAPQTCPVFEDPLDTTPQPFAAVRQGSLFL